MSRPFERAIDRLLTPIFRHNVSVAGLGPKPAPDYLERCYENGTLGSKILILVFWRIVEVKTFRKSY